jgi:hypothetical protein
LHRLISFPTALCLFAADVTTIGATFIRFTVNAANRLHARNSAAQGVFGDKRFPKASSNCTSSTHTTIK